MFVVCLQCVAALSDGSTPSAVYGAEHLLRLMLKLPEIMPTAGMTPAQVAGLSAKLQVRDCEVWILQWPHAAAAVVSFHTLLLLHMCICLNAQLCVV